MAPRRGPRTVDVPWLPLGMGALTLPPFGILFRRGRRTEGLRRHELVHWRQYLERGVVRFYLGYVWHWIRAGRSYEHHPWEQEARELSGSR